MAKLKSLFTPTLIPAVNYAPKKTEKQKKKRSDDDVCMYILHVTNIKNLLAALHVPEKKNTELTKIGSYITMECVLLWLFACNSKHK